MTAPSTYTTPRAAVFAQLCNSLIDDELNEFSYPATLAGADYKITRKSTGMQIFFSGFSHKLPQLIEAVVERLGRPALHEARFVLMRESLLRTFLNHYKDKPLSIIRYEARQMLESGRHHILAYIDVLSDDAVCNHADLKDYGHNTMLAKAHLSVHCHGNTTRYQANAIVGGIAAALKLAPLPLADVPELNQMKLPTEQEICLRLHASFADERLLPMLNADETNSAIELTLQGDVDCRPASVLTEFLGKALANAAFEQLRTTEQLGYIVGLGTSILHGVWRLTVCVQSHHKDAAYLDERVEAFLATVPTLIADMDDEQFDDYKHSLINDKLSPPKSLAEEASIHWAEISGATYEFSRPGDDARAIHGLTKDMLIEYWFEVFHAQAPRRRKLSSQFFAPAQTPPPKSAKGVGGLRPIIYLDGIEAIAEYKKQLVVWESTPKAHHLAALRVQYHWRRHVRRRPPPVEAA